MKRGTKGLKRSGFKQTTTISKKTVKPRSKASVASGKRSKLPNIKTIRNKCDALLTPITKLKHKYCFLRGSENCAGITQVAHHHIKKSNSSALRYDLDNLIPLCTCCHMMLHQNESKWVTILIQKKGMEWAQGLLEKNVIIKTDVHFYISNYERLKAIHDDYVAM